MRAWSPALGLVMLAALGILPPASRAALPPARSKPAAARAMALVPPATARERLLGLCDRYWQGLLRAHPMVATSVGVRRYDALLDDISPAGIDRERAWLETTRAEAAALDTASLEPADRLSWEALRLDVRDRLDALSCHDEEWVVDPFNGPQVSLLNLTDLTVIETPEQAVIYVKRCRAMGPYLDQHIANLERGLAAKRVAPAALVRDVQRQVEAFVRRPLERSVLLSPLDAPHEKWPAGAREAFRRDLTRAVDEVVVPAFTRYRDFLDQRLARVARADERAGMSFLPGGPECYAKRIRIETSLDMTPEALHQLGLEQVARARGELAAIGSRVLGTGEMLEIQQKQRGDPAMRFANEDEVVEVSRRALARAEAALPAWFGLRPKAACEVRTMDNAGASLQAFYRPPMPGGARPGYYMLSTAQPQQRLRDQAEVLVFHESIPGHHVQVAIAQELAGVPEFRKHQKVTAFAEGWALYAERLADEMGLYSSDIDRIGMLSYDAWRACRLVVDTGLHAMGWTRREAADYLTENSLLSATDVENEIDRCLAWPGQALAYKVGQLEILKLREEGKQRLGSRFDIKGFHDALLRNGAVALPVLREQVEAYYAQVEAGK